MAARGIGANFLLHCTRCRWIKNQMNAKAQSSSPCSSPDAAPARQLRLECGERTLRAKIISSLNSVTWRTEKLAAGWALSALSLRTASLSYIPTRNGAEASYHSRGCVMRGVDIFGLKGRLAEIGSLLCFGASKQHARPHGRCGTVHAVGCAHPHGADYRFFPILF